MAKMRLEKYEHMRLFGHYNGAEEILHSNGLGELFGKWSEEHGETIAELAAKQADDEESEWRDKLRVARYK